MRKVFLYFGFPSGVEILTTGVVSAGVMTQGSIGKRSPNYIIGNKVMNCNGIFNMNDPKETPLLN